MIRVIERHGLSQRHACELVGLDHSTFALPAQTTGRLGNEATTAVAQAGIACELAEERLHLEYRRFGWMLAREGYVLNHKQLYRGAVGSLCPMCCP